MDNNLVKSLARLTALKNNMPNTSIVLKKYADEFNSILVELEKNSDCNLAEFLFPDYEIRVIPHRIGEWCEKDFLLMKVDGVLGYFTLILQPTEVSNKLGFDVGKNNQK